MMIMIMIMMIMIMMVNNIYAEEDLLRNDSSKEYLNKIEKIKICDLMRLK